MNQQNEAAQIYSELAAKKTQSQASWQASDYAQFATCLEPGLADFASRLTIMPGQQVLDVACGSGNFALLAAERHAIVTGIDFNPDALAVARQRAADAHVDIHFDEGDIEQMPYAANTFDSAVSVFGIMFAINADAAAREVARVTKSGGVLAIASWTADSLVGELSRVLARYQPSDPKTRDNPGNKRTTGWGDVGQVSSYLEAYTRQLQLTKRMWRYEFPYGPSDVVHFFRQYASTHKLVFDRLGEADAEALHHALEQVWVYHNQATDGTVIADAEYLDVTAVFK
ncbi:MAG: methyltransferase domain-containing protein [Chloroflexota bacterium]